MIVSIPYSPGRVAKIKTIAGRRWHPGEKCWTVPSAEGTIATLSSLFAGEAMEIDPALGSPPSQDRPNLPRDCPAAPIPALLDGVHQAVRKPHYSEKINKAYAHWIKRFLRFHENRHLAQMREAEVGQFLTHLAQVACVSAESGITCRGIFVSRGAGATNWPAPRSGSSQEAAAVTSRAHREEIQKLLR